MPPSAVTTETPFWQLPLSVLLVQLVASPDGLSGEEAALRLTRFGPNLVPGDGRVLVAKDFFVNQALLTGEPYPVEKSPGELSEIADSLLVKAPPISFELGTHRFGFLIMRMTVLLELFVLLVNAFFHRPWLESFLFAMALAVGLAPELLPMVVSVTLSRGALRMATNKVIVKRLASIHNLGSMDVFCTDKTGTLTEARIHLERHINPLGKESQRVLELACYNSFLKQV